MNLVGKIFIVLILVMSITFMGIAVAVYATHTNWRAVVEGDGTNRGLKAELEDARVETQRLTDELTKTQEQLASEQNAKRAQLAKAEGEYETLSQERNQLDQQLAVKTQQVRDLTAATDAAHQTLAKLRTEVDGLRTSIRQAQKERDDSFAEVAEKTDQAHELANQLDVLKKQSVKLAEDVSKAMAVLRQFGLKPEPAIYAKTPTTGVEGLVTAVRPGGLLEINIGADDGLRKGHQLHVYRIAGGLSTYLGKIEVTETEPDKAVGKILPEFRKGTIQVNDSVATSLK